MLVNGIVIVVHSENLVVKIGIKIMHEAMAMKMDKQNISKQPGTKFSTHENTNVL